MITPIVMGREGGMEGQAPWMRNKKEETAVVAATTPSAFPPVPVTSAPAIVAAVVDLSSLMENLSFASTVEDKVTCAINLPFTMILDSGTTVTLIED